VDSKKEALLADHGSDKPIHASVEEGQEPRVAYGIFDLQSSDAFRGLDPNKWFNHLEVQCEAQPLY
jgi:hypothetical protein